MSAKGGVYITSLSMPVELYERIKRLEVLNVSAVCTKALREVVEKLEHERAQAVLLETGNVARTMMEKECVP